MKHTPGPWEIKDGFDKDGKGKFFPSVVFCEDGLLGESSLCVNQSHDQEAESIMANARLIAKAPVMIEAIVKFEEGWEHFLKCIDFGRSYLDSEAIAWMNEIGLSTSAIVEELKDEGS